MNIRYRAESSKSIVKGAARERENHALSRCIRMLESRAAWVLLPPAGLPLWLMISRKLKGVAD